MTLIAFVMVFMANLPSADRLDGELLSAALQKGAADYHWNLADVCTLRAYIERL
jgi:hypothetical protein